MNGIDVQNLKLCDLDALAGRIVIEFKGILRLKGSEVSLGGGTYV